ncbi:MAG TPA: sodium-dependent transporter [Pseudohongiella sp.]|nr:sodium-dependent transporter [Pseudohongiella sp.]
MAIDRGQFSSRLGFVLAAAGSAVGLGNLVAFPVMASKNGGAVFLMVYILFVALICFPVLLAEIAIGRHTRRNPVGAFSALTNNSTGWRWAGKLAIVTPFMIAVFYTVVTVWILIFLFRTLTGDLSILATDAAFGDMIGSPGIFPWFVLLQILVFGVLLGGVKGGIERLARVFMPTLALMLVGLILFVMTLDDAMLGVQYYLVPDFSRLDGQVINAALNQAFFSLSLGMGIMITYGSYFSREDNIPNSGKMVAVADTSVAFMAGLLILPAIFAFNPATDPDDLSTSSVGLIFTYLPQIFLSMQDAVGYFGASMVATVFFALVFFAAVTSLVSILEIPIAYMIDEWNFSRRKAVLVQATLVTLCAVLAALSFGMSPMLTDFIPYGGGPKSLFDLIADTFSEVILPLVGFFACIICAYRWRDGFAAELGSGDAEFSSSGMARYLTFSLRTFVPVVLLFVFINSVAAKYFAIDLIAFLAG